MDTSQNKDEGKNNSTRSITIHLETVALDIVVAVTRTGIHPYSILEIAFIDEGQTQLLRGKRP